MAKIYPRHEKAAESLKRTLSQGPSPAGCLVNALHEANLGLTKRAEKGFWGDGLDIRQIPNSVLSSHDNLAGPCLLLGSP